jgi:hypothetical protein
MDGYNLVISLTNLTMPDIVRYDDDDGDITEPGI